MKTYEVVYYIQLEDDVEPNEGTFNDSLSLNNQGVMRVFRLRSDDKGVYHNEDWNYGWNVVRSPEEKALAVKGIEREE